VVVVAVTDVALAVAKVVAVAAAEAVAVVLNVPKAHLPLH